MSDVMKFLNLFINAGLLALCAGAAFTFGCASVCRWMSWAPINITIHNHAPVPAASNEAPAA